LWVLANRDEIQQVILNLLLNAEHAIASSSGRGKINIVTSSAGGYHAVELVDTGPGIPPDLRGRIFEPFFTTKQVGEGTGLGLSISHGIASAHGGSLELHESASGARFRLTLPAHAGAQPAEHAYAGRPVVSRRALVVDDEVHIRHLMVRLLQRRGFEVLSAETADAALSLAMNNGVGLILCDVRMPGLSGPDLYRRLAAANLSPKPRFVFITGDTTSLDVDPELAGALVLRKPFTAADLDAVLART
jgi:CheY-like chemotaxis protein